MSHRAQYEVSLCDATQELWVTRQGAQGTVERDGVTYEIHAVGPDEYLVRKAGAGQAHRVWVRLDGEVPQVAWRGRSEKVQIISARDKALARAQGASASAGGGKLSSPMPGRIVSVLVKAGQSVKAGEPVIIVEAMKMENELTAPIEGEVTSIAVGPDQAVDAGQTLCVIEPASE